MKASKYKNTKGDTHGNFIRTKLRIATTQRKKSIKKQQQ